MSKSMTGDHIQIKIKMPNPSQEPPGTSKAPNEDLKDECVLCTFKIEIEGKNLGHGYIIKQLSYPSKIKMSNPSQEPPASSNPPNKD